jgi:hypothetical protein
MVEVKAEKGFFPRVIGTRINLVLGIIALMIIIGSLSALVYNAANTRSTDILTVNGKDYDWETLESDFEIMEFAGHSGIPVEDLLEDAGIEDPAGRSFRFIGADGYEKEVPFSDMENGMINTDEKKVIFPELAKAFWVRDLVEIEVV